jgi:hypothetical protein
VFSSLPREDFRALDMLVIFKPEAYGVSSITSPWKKNSRVEAVALL